MVVSLSKVVFEHCSLYSVCILEEMKHIERFISSFTALSQPVHRARHQPVGGFFWENINMLPHDLTGGCSVLRRCFL
jgi:hypothetical protein